MPTSPSTDNTSLEQPLAVNAPPAHGETIVKLFQQSLLDNLDDGVIFVDRRLNIISWNKKLESMTGISWGKVEGLKMTPQLVGFSASDGTTILDSNNPLLKAIKTGTSIQGEYRLVGRSGRQHKVEMSFNPVIDARGQIHGGVVLIHDASIQLDLQRQLKDLYRFSMLDPLTQVSNRLEFEKAMEEFVRSRHASGLKCSLIVTDIDFFKKINDNFNHHIGDLALVAFADLLRKFVRTEDVVARYGGEEFVIICADCDLEAASQRAEEIRIELTESPQPMLGGKCITASFGVAEVEDNDTATDLFVRADSALLEAKEMGRNRVVAAQVSIIPGRPDMKKVDSGTGGMSWRKITNGTLICEEYTTSTPLSLIIEKLRGYIIETEAEIRSVESDFASLNIERFQPQKRGRKGRFVLEIEFNEKIIHLDKETKRRETQTLIRVNIREQKKGWFSANANELAPSVIAELRRHLMITEVDLTLKPKPVGISGERR
ncbi:MAG: diguanylate cyclase [Mariniblastus sp.]|nr:diguanylate cyclase [Mariniblastus sp.]MDG2183789.1 diguanylate cyclase [Mariniblastus sp.]